VNGGELQKLRGNEGGKMTRKRMVRVVEEEDKGRSKNSPWRWGGKGGKKGKNRKMKKSLF